MNTRVFKPINSFLNTVKNNYIPKANELVDKINIIVDNLGRLGGYDSYIIIDIIRVYESIKDIYCSIENMFNEYGGLLNIYSRNEKCFEIYETSDSEEISNICMLNYLISVKCKSIMTKLNKQIMDINFYINSFNSNEVRIGEFKKILNAIQNNYTEMNTLVSAFTAAYATTP